MSTRSNIVIRLRKEDTNKTFTTPWGEEVCPNGSEYLSIYCHHDGYPEGVGNALYNMNMSYDEALDYILNGDRSTTELSYWAWRDEQCAPAVEDSPEYNQAYLYVLEEQNGPDKPMTLMIAEPESKEVKLVPFDIFDE